VWNAQIRPHGEYFAKGQALSATATLGNLCLTEAKRLDASQGDNPIRLCVADGSTVIIPSATQVDMTVYGSDDPNVIPVIDPNLRLGYTRYYSSAVEETFSEGMHLCSYNVDPEVLALRPYVWVSVSSPTATGSIDIFPAYLGQGGR
jgi:hypothetical protein